MIELKSVKPRTRIAMRRAGAALTRRQVLAVLSLSQQRANELALFFYTL
jgi:hypothetical protein